MGWLARAVGGCLVGFLLAGCGDKCEVLCQQTANRLANCKPDALSWGDLGARSRNHFAESCRNDWFRVSSELTSNDLRIALEVCAETSRELDDMSCAELTALYAVSE